MKGMLIIEREIFIAAPPETVFRFFVEPAFMVRWFGRQHTLDPRPGGIFRVEVNAGKFACGIYREVTPHRRIAFTWGWEGRDDLPPGRSLVEIELVPKGSGTLLRLRHSGLPTIAEAPFTPDEHRRRWSRYLARLERAVRNSDGASKEDIMNVMQERDTTTIRQAVTFKASPQDVYEMIMDSKKHESLSGEKASISREVGGAFKAWGDHISGFNLVLQPGRKIVQAWRAQDWWTDHYSIATFDLHETDGGTELRFTQIGVPPHRFDGHSRGWIETYWQPMQELFDKGALSGHTRTANAAARQRIDQGDL
jgi:uncharacterized protein YndB with AHSA1/START domain